jgi:hypothetical protein
VADVLLDLQLAALLALDHVFDEVLPITDIPIPGGFWILKHLDDASWVQLVLPHFVFIDRLCAEVILAFVVLFLRKDQVLLRIYSEKVDFLAGLDIVVVFVMPVVHFLATGQLVGWLFIVFLSLGVFSLDGEGLVARVGLCLEERVVYHCSASAFGDYLLNQVGCLCSTVVALINW